MTFLGYHLRAIDYIVWALWLAWALSIGVLVNECCKDLHQSAAVPESSEQA